MAKKITISKLITVPAGTESETVIYTVEAAKKFRIKKIKIYFLSASGFKLRVEIFVGIFKIGPSRGFYASDGPTVEDEIDFEASSGDRIIAKCKNVGTSDQDCLVMVQGELGE